MKKYTITPINTGFVMTSTKDYHFHHSAHKYLKNISMEDIPLPVFCFLIENEDIKVLVDTGMSETSRANKYHHPGSWQEDGMDICSQLNKLGVKPEEIHAVIFTHLHWDHCYYMKAFKNARFMVHTKEYDFAMNPIPVYYKSYEHPFLGIERPFENVIFETFDQEVELFPGITVIETFGHSPGHICVEVDTEKGKYIIGGDVAFRVENFSPVSELGYEVIPPSRFVNIVDSYNSILKIKNRLVDLQHLLLCHDTGLLDMTKENPTLGKGY